MKPGDRVIYERYAGQTYTIDNEDLVLVRERDILGILSGAGRKPLEIPASTSEKGTTAIVKKAPGQLIKTKKPQPRKRERKNRIRGAIVEDERVKREKKILSILEQELEDGESLASEARKMVSYLLVEKKGYLPEDIEKKVVFEVKLGQETAHSSVDFLISIAGKRAMVIKCAAGSLSSRERQAVAAARLIGSPPVPVAVVADPVNAEVLDVATGEVVGEGFGAIPVRDRIIQILSEGKAGSLRSGLKRKREFCLPSMPYAAAFRRERMVVLI